MKRIDLILRLALLLLLAATPSNAGDQAAQMLYPVGFPQGHGYIDTTGKPAFQGRFEEAGRFSEGFAPVKVDGKWGFIDRSGKVVIQPRFEVARGFSEGLAAVTMKVEGLEAAKGKWWDNKPREGDTFEQAMARKMGNKRYGYIDTDGKVVIEPRFVFAHDFSCGLAMFVDGDLDGFIDKRGNVVIEPEFDTWWEPYRGIGIGDTKDAPEPDKPDFAQGTRYFYASIATIPPMGFSGGLLPVYMDGKGGYIDTSGEWAIEPNFKRVEQFMDGLAKVLVDDPDNPYHPAVIDKQGQIIDVAPYTLTQDPAIEGMIMIAHQPDPQRSYETTFGFADKTGKVVIKPIFKSLKPFTQGLAAARLDDKWGYIGRSGEWAIEPRFWLAESFYGGAASVHSENQGPIQYINTIGEVIWQSGSKLPLPSYSEGLSATCFPSLSGFIDATGRVIVGPLYERVDEMSEGMAVVWSEGKAGYVNFKGELAIKLKYSDAEPFQGGLALVRSDGSYGFIDKQGKAAIPLEYEGLSEFSDGMARFYRDGKRGYINQAGEEVIAPRFDSRTDFHEGLCVVSEDNQRFYVIDKTGAEQFELPAVYRQRPEFSEGLLCWGKNVYDTNGKLVISFDKEEYELGQTFQNGLCRLTVNGKVGFIDHSGELVVPAVYEKASWRFQEGLIGVKKDGLYGFIDGRGKLVIEHRFTGLPSGGFEAGFCLVQMGGIENQGTWPGEAGWQGDGLIDRTGKFVFGPRVMSIRSPVGGIMKVHDYHDWQGYMNLDGEWIWKQPW